MKKFGKLTPFFVAAGIALLSLNQAKADPHFDKAVNSAVNLMGPFSERGQQIAMCYRAALDALILTFVFGGGLLGGRSVSYRSSRKHYNNPNGPV